MYITSDKGYLRSVEPTPSRPQWWHVFGGPLSGTNGGHNNFPTVTAGPVPKEPDEEVRTTSLSGTGGELFTYLGSFTHDPSDTELDTLKPKEYRSR
jgi:hypothetical protein